MSKNIIYTFASERKRTKDSHEITSAIETFIQMYNKRIIHVQLIIFLKGKHCLDTC
jgi:predicted component of type VI protein secretion system